MASTHTLRVNTEEAVKSINMCLHTRLVCMLSGSPGIGKSAIVHQLAAKYKLKLIDIRLSQCDPTDLLGLPQVNGKRAKYLPMDIFPLEDDDIPDGYNGWLVFLDEFNAASLAVQAASYRILLDRQIGQYNLHNKVLLVAAGNLITDNGIVNRLSTAMQSRLIHLELMVDHKLWSMWASSNKLSHEVISYINHRPDHLHRFDPNHNDRTFACPRTWEFASRIMQYQGLPLRDKLPGIAGAISEGIAREFLTYCEVYNQIPTYKQIVAEASTLHITSEPSMLAALAGTIGANVTASDLPQVMKYVERMPAEFQVFTLRDALKRNPKIMKEKPILDWITVNSSELF